MDGADDTFTDFCDCCGTAYDWSYPGKAVLTQESRLHALRCRECGATTFLEFRDENRDGWVVKKRKTLNGNHEST